MKRIKLLTILLLSILIITGCTKKTSTCDEFNRLAREQGFEVVDYTKAYGYANKAYQTSNDSHLAFFVEGKKQKEVQGIFLDEVKNIYVAAGVKSKSERENSEEDQGPEPIKNGGDSWGTVEITTDDTYYYISYIKNTMLYIKCNISEKDKFVHIKDTMKY